MRLAGLVFGTLLASTGIAAAQTCPGTPSACPPLSTSQINLGGPILNPQGVPFVPPVALPAAGQVLTATDNAGHTAWQAGGTGSVTSTSVATANGFSGSVADATTTPQITIILPVTGMLKGNGTGVSAAIAGTDYLPPGGSGASLTGLTWGQIGSTPTTLGGYGVPVTGTGSAVQATSPTLITPNLGTPSAVTLTNGTGLPVAGLSGLGTGAATALGLGVNTNGGMWLGGSDLQNQPVTIPNVGQTQLGPALAGACGVSTTGCTNAGPFNTTSASGYQKNGLTILNSSGAANQPALFAGVGAGAAFPIATGQWIVGIGNQSFASFTASANEGTGLGTWSCTYEVNGADPTCIGVAAMHVETGNDDTAVGNDAMRNTVGTNNNNAFGVASLRNGAGSFNVALGTTAMQGNAESITITGTATTGDVISLAFSSTNPAVSGVPASASYTVKGGDTLASIATGIQTAINAINPAISGQSVLMTASLNYYTGGPATVGLDNPAGWTLTITPSVSGAATETVTVSANTSYSNTAIGFQAMYGTGLIQAKNNVAIGEEVMPFVSNAHEGVCIGGQACWNTTSDYQFVALGFEALYSQTGGTHYNIGLGYQAGYGVTSGNNNIAIGAEDGGNTGCITTGQDNVQIGYNACIRNPADNGDLSIQNIIFGQGNIAGGSSISTGTVGIGIKLPGARFDIAGIDTSSSTLAFRVQNSTPAVLFSVADDGTIKVGSTAGVTCSGTPTSSFASTNGIVTHC